MERCCPSRSALRENDLSAALGSPHALPRKGDGPHAPSIFMSFADACRRGISRWYSEMCATRPFPGLPAGFPSVSALGFVLGAMAITEQPDLILMDLDLPGEKSDPGRA